MYNINEKYSENKLKVIRFSGVLVFVGSFILITIYTGYDQFLKRCVANGNSIKYCNAAYDDRKFLFTQKEVELLEKKIGS